jgi:hypothetical protein
MLGPKAIEAVSTLFKDPWTFLGSLFLHTLLLLALSILLAPRILPPLVESVPVEIWSPEDWAAVDKTPTPEPVPSATSEPAIPTQPAKAAPQSFDSIRATAMLSQAALAHPQSRAMRVALGQMEEETRLEQLCDIEAMAQIAAHLQVFKPDRIVAYAKAEMKLMRNILIADGAAFRSNRIWYALTFKCELSKDRQMVQAFEFSVGNAIPRRDWERYSLPSPSLDID